MSYETKQQQISKEMHDLSVRLENFTKSKEYSKEYSKGYSDCKKEYEEKLRWIPISEKKPEPRKDISLKLENFSNSEITGFMGYSGEFYIKLTDIIDCNNVKLKCKVTHWRSFL